MLTERVVGKEMTTEKKRWTRASADDSKDAANSEELGVACFRKKSISALVNAAPATAPTSTWFIFLMPKKLFSTWRLV